MNRAATAFVILITATTLSGQTPPASPQPPARRLPQPQMAPQQPKNVQLLKGMSPMELIRVMQFFTVSLGVNCDFCHLFKPGGERDFASDDKEEKRTAREMIKLVMDNNSKFFHDRPVVSCNTCHRGSPSPVNVPLLPLSAPQPRPEPPASAEAKPAMPTRDDIVARYAAALGTIDPKAIANMELKGTRDMAHSSARIDVLMSDGKIRINTSTPEGPMVNVVNGNAGWITDARGTHAMQQTQLDSMNQLLDALRLPLPADIPAQARVARDRVGDREVWVLTSRGTNGRQRFYFDQGTGLLVRRLILTATPVGSIPQQTDFDDYRDVGGFKLPFTVRFDSVDRGASRVVHYTEITPNAKIDERVFEPPQ